MASKNILLFIVCIIYFAYPVCASIGANCGNCSNVSSDYLYYDNGEINIVGYTNITNGAKLNLNGWSDGNYNCLNSNVYADNFAKDGTLSIQVNGDGGDSACAWIPASSNLLMGYHGLMGFWVYYPANISNSGTGSVYFIAGTNNVLGFNGGQPDYVTWGNFQIIANHPLNKGDWIWATINFSGINYYFYYNNSYLGTTAASGNSQNLGFLQNTQGTGLYYVDGFRMTKNNTYSFPEMNITGEPPADTSAPSYSSLSNNGTPSYYNDTIGFSVSFTDDTALSGYRFAHNLSGVMLNSTYGTLSGLSANVIETIKSTERAPRTVCAQFWVNDTSGNFNQTEFTCYSVTPKIDYYEPVMASMNRGNPLLFNFTFDFNAVACFLCLNLTAGVYSCPVNVTSSNYNLTNTTTLYNISDGLKNLYKFEENGGTIIIDELGFVNGTNINSVSYQPSKGGNSTGSYSFYFDGTNDYLDMGRIGNFSGTQPFSFSFWSRTATASTIATAFARMTSVDYKGYRGYLNAGAWYFGIYASSTSGAIVKTTSTWNNNVWHNVVMTYDGSGVSTGLKIYIDKNSSIVSVRNDLSGSIITSQNFWIGARNDGGYYVDYLDEFMIFNKSLSQSEINNIYDNGAYSSYSYNYTVTVNGSLEMDIENTLPYTFPSNTVNNYNSYIICMNSVTVNSSIINFNYDNDFTAPSISISSPNVSYNETYNGTVLISFTTTELSNCFVNNSGFVLNYSNGSSFIFSDSGNVSSGFNAVLITCYDASLNYAYQPVYFTKDITYPAVLIYSPLNNTEYSAALNKLRLNVSFRDDRDLYDYSINISYFNTDIGETVNIYSEAGIVSGYTWYNISRLLNFSSFPNGTLFSLDARACDSHTAKEIGDAEAVKKDKNALTFQFKDVQVKVSSASGSETKADTVKLKDRYTFSFQYSKPEKKIFYVECTQPLVYLPNSPYQAHFICGKHWIDFEDSIKGGLKPIVTKDGERYRVDIDNSDLSLGFNSVGELNCIQSSITFSKAGITPENLPFGLNLDITSTGGMLFIFALLIFYLGLMFLGFTFNNMGFVGFGFLIGIVLGLVLAQFHIFLMLMFTFTNIGILLSFARKQR